MSNIPLEIEEEIRVFTHHSEVEHVVASDLGPDGFLGEQWLVITRDWLYVISRNHRGTSIQHRVRMADLTDIRSERLVGNSCLVAKIDGDYTRLIRYSNALLREFGYATRLLNALAKGKEKPVPVDADVAKRCPKCGLPLEPSSNVCSNCPSVLRPIIRLFGYARPYKRLILAAAALMIASRAFQLVPPYLMKILVDDVLRPAELYRGNVATDGRGHLVGILGMIVLGLVISGLASTALEILQNRIAARLGARVVHDIRTDLYSVVHRLPVAFFDRRQTGTVISQLSKDTSALQQHVASDIQFTASNTVILLLILAAMFTQNWRMAFLAVMPVPFVVTLALVIFARQRWLHKRVWRKWSRLHSAMSSALQGLRIVKAFAQQDREVRRFCYHSEQLCSASVAAGQLIGTVTPIMWFSLIAGQFVVWYAGGISVIHATATLGTLVMFTYYTGMLLGPLQMAGRLWDWVGRCTSAAERVFETMDAQLEQSVSEARMEMPQIKGRVRFRKVTFGYDNDMPVLHGIDLEVPTGEMLGLAGHSGAGKSTMMNLLMGFYAPQEGSIEIDGVDIRKMHLEDLRKQVGVVPQDAYLFSGTIWENIAYAKPDATPGEVIRAAKVANAHDFIIGLSDGYETQVGERGQSLSGGERQRIAIARAILHDPRILILDEATSSVDTETEKKIQEALRRLRGNRTTFAIAHRLSTLRSADRLLVLEKGRQVELGTHDELLQRNGAYAKLVKMQAEMSSIIAVGG